jgi:hypothetical protein
MLQPVIAKIGNRLLGWKNNFFSYPGRDLLVKFVHSVMHSYFLTVHKMPRWGFSRIDRFRICFLWRGENPYRAKGDHCLVNCQVCTRPKKLGSLGIKDLNKFSRALRLMWL